MSIDGSAILITKDPYAKRPQKSFVYGDVTTDAFLCEGSRPLTPGGLQYLGPHFAGGSNIHFAHTDTSLPSSHFHSPD